MAVRITFCENPEIADASGIESVSGPSGAAKFEFCIRAPFFVVFDKTVQFFP
jgi:hypothetical protein